MRRGTFSKKKRAAGWRTAAPRTQAETRRLYRHCGPQAFLLPNATDPELSKFPVMSKGSQVCAFDCRGLRSAFSRARQYGQPKVARKALKLARKSACAWAR